MLQDICPSAHPMPMRREEEEEVGGDEKYDYDYKYIPSVRVKGHWWVFVGEENLLHPVSSLYLLMRLA